ncbi:MAG: hypothetical protein HY832_02860 [Candidatus Aenigmarchaeota archaeon]|nr:hypothetical protein [Candidatus Aenigmarchaeota archaeon]
MRLDMVIGGLLVVLLVVLTVADYNSANGKALDDYAARYATCLSDLESVRSSFVAVSDSDPQKIAFNECIGRGGCYQLCGSACETGPSISFAEYLEQRLTGPKGCILMCVSGCITA